MKIKRLRLRRSDGRVYLDRWGIQSDRIGGIFLHKLQAPDPSMDLHGHPWAFVSLVLWGGYIEERSYASVASLAAKRAEETGGNRGRVVVRRTGTIKSLARNECHRITKLRSKTCWTLVVHGPVRRVWGFYTPQGWMDEQTYNKTVRSERRDLWAEIG